MTTTQTQENKPIEVATFLITKLLITNPQISYKTVIGGLRKAGVPDGIINQAWYKATTETEVEK